MESPEVTAVREAERERRARINANENLSEAERQRRVDASWEQVRAAVASAQAEEPQAEQPSAEQPSAEQPSAEQPSAEQPSAEQPSAEQPSAAQPSGEQPSEQRSGGLSPEELAEVESPEVTAVREAERERRARINANENLSEAERQDRVDASWEQVRAAVASAQAEEPQAEQPSAEPPSGEQPSGEQPSGEQPSGEQPSGEQAQAGASSGEQPPEQRSGGLSPEELAEVESPEVTAVREAERERRARINANENLSEAERQDRVDASWERVRGAVAQSAAPPQPQAPAGPAPDPTAAGAAPDGPEESVGWQTVRGETVRDFSYDAATGETTRTSEMAHNGAQRTDVFTAAGGLNTTIERDDGSRREIRIRPDGTRIETEFDAEGERLSREETQSAPPVAPVAPTSATVTEDLGWTQTNGNANLVDVATDATSGTTVATHTRQDGGEETRRWNADGSMTWTTEFADRSVRGSVDPQGNTVRQVYRDGELVSEEQSVTAQRVAPTVGAEQLAQVDETIYVTGNGERADQDRLADASVTDRRITEAGVDVRRTVAENGVGLTVRDDGATTVYRQADENGWTTVRRVDGETGEVTRREFQGTAPQEITLPQYVRDDADPEVAVSTTPAGQPVTTTTWSDGTTLTEYSMLSGDQVVETSLPNGLQTEQRRDVDGDVVTLQQQTSGETVLSTRHSDGAGAQQELPEGLELPLAAVEVVDTDERFENVEIRNRPSGRQVATFDWGDWEVRLDNRRNGTARWDQAAGADALESLNPEPSPDAGEDGDDVDWQTWEIGRSVDRAGELVRREETRSGDDGEQTADGLFEVTEDGGTASSWRAEDPDGRSLSLVDTGADGSIRQVNELDPEFGADYRSVYRVDAEGNVLSTLRWDETDFGNGVSDFRVRQDADGEGFVRYGRQGTGEEGMRIVFTDVTDRFDDGRPTITEEEREFARRNGRVITGAVSVDRGEGWRRGDPSLIILPDWTTMELGDGMAEPPSRDVADGSQAPGGGPEETGEEGAGPRSQAPVTVARYLGSQIAQGFGAEGLAAGTIANTAAGLAGLAGGDENALRATAGAIASEGVTELADDVFTGEWSGAAGSAGYLAGHFVGGGDVDDISWGSGVAKPVVDSLATDAISGVAGDTLGGALGPLAGTVVGLGIDAATGRRIQVEDELIKAGATAACTAAGTPLLGMACGAIAGFLTGIIGGPSKPDDLAEEFSHAYDDHENRTRNPFAELVDDARGDDGAHEELWTFGDDTNLAGELRFAPDQAGQLTRQAYLASSAPNTTRSAEAQRREDYADLARELSAGNPGMRQVANYLQASAEFADRSRGKGDAWFRNQFDQAAQRLGLTEQFGVDGASGDMTIAEARAAIDEAGKRLGYDVFNPFTDDADPTRLRDFDALRADREAAAAAENREAGEAGENDEAADEDWRRTAPQRDRARPGLYAGDWWDAIYAAQDRLAGRDIADVVPNTFGDWDKDGIDDMADEDVYRTFLRPTYIGPDDDENTARQAHQAREAATADIISQIRRYGPGSDVEIDPELAGLLIQDGLAGMTHPASFAPREAPLLLQDDPPAFDIANGVAQIVTTGADAVASLTAGSGSPVSDVPDPGEDDAPADPNGAASDELFGLLPVGDAGALDVLRGGGTDRPDVPGGGTGGPDVPAVGGTGGFDVLPGDPDGLDVPGGGPALDLTTAVRGGAVGGREGGAPAVTAGDPGSEVPDSPTTGPGGNDPAEGRARGGTAARTAEPGPGPALPGALDPVASSAASPDRPLFTSMSLPELQQALDAGRLRIDTTTTTGGVGWLPRTADPAAGDSPSRDGSGAPDEPGTTGNAPAVLPVGTLASIALGGTGSDDDATPGATRRGPADTPGGDTTPPVAPVPGGAPSGETPLSTRGEVATTAPSGRSGQVRAEQGDDALAGDAAATGSGGDTAPVPWWGDEAVVGRTAAGELLPELLFSDLDTRRGALRATDVNVTALEELSALTGSPEFDPVARAAALQQGSARNLSGLSDDLRVTLGDTPATLALDAEARRLARIARGVPPSAAGEPDPAALVTLQALDAARDDPNRSVDFVESYLDLARQDLSPAQQATLRLGVDRVRDAQRDLALAQQEALPTSAVRVTGQPGRDAVIACVDALCGRTQVANMVASTVDTEVTGSTSVGLPEGVLPAGMSTLANAAGNRVTDLREGRASLADAIGLEQILQELSDWTGEISADQQVTGAYELPGMEERRALLAGAQDARAAYNATLFDQASTTADRDAARQGYVAAVQDLYSGTLPVVVDGDGNVSFSSVPLSVDGGIAADPGRVAQVDALSGRIATQPVDLLYRTLGRSPSLDAFRSRLLGPRPGGSGQTSGEVVASLPVGGSEPSEPVTQPLVRPGLVAQREVRQLFSDPELFSPRLDLGVDRFLDPADVASLDVVDSLSIVEDVNERPRLTAQAVQALRQDTFRTMRDNGADLRYVFREPLGRTLVSLVENGAKATVAVFGGGPAGQVVLRPFNENLFKPAAEELVRPADPSVIADASTARLFRTDVPRPGVQDVTGRPFGFTLGQLQRPDGFPLTVNQPPLVAADGSPLRSPTRLQTLGRQMGRAAAEGAANLVLASPVPIPGEDLVLGLRQNLDTPTLLRPDGQPLGDGPGRVQLFDARNRPIGARPAPGRVYVPSEFVVDPEVRRFYTDRRAPIAEVAEAFDLPTLGELTTSLPTGLVTSDVAVTDIRNTSEVNAAIRDLVPDEVRNTDWQVSSAPRVTLGQRLSGLRPRALPGTIRGALTTSGPGMTANAARRAGQAAVQTVIPQDGFLTRLSSDAITGLLRFGEVRFRQWLAGKGPDNRAARIDATDGFTDYTTGNALLSGLELLTPGAGTAAPSTVGPADVGGLLAGGLVGLTPQLSRASQPATPGPALPGAGPARLSVGRIDVPEPGGAAALPPELLVTPAEETGPVLFDPAWAQVSDVWTPSAAVGTTPADAVLPDLLPSVTDPFDPDRPLLDGLPVADPTVAFDPSEEPFTPVTSTGGVLAEVPAPRLQGGVDPAPVVLDVEAVEMPVPLLPGGDDAPSAGVGAAEATAPRSGPGPVGGDVAGAVEPDVLRPVPFDPSADPVRPAGLTGTGELVEVPVPQVTGDRSPLVTVPEQVTVDVPSRPVGRPGIGVDLTDLGRGGAGLGTEVLLDVGSEAVLRPYLVDQGVLAPTQDEALLAGLIEGRTATAPPVESTMDTVVYRTFAGMGSAGAGGFVVGGPVGGGVSALASIPGSLITAADRTLPGSISRGEAVADLARDAYLALPAQVRGVTDGIGEAVVGVADAVSGGAASDALAAADVADIRTQMRVAEQARRIEEFTAARGTPIDLTGASVERIALAYQYSGLAAVDEVRASLAAPRTPSVLEMFPDYQPPRTEAGAPSPAFADRDAWARELTGFGLCTGAAAEANCIPPEQFRPEEGRVGSVRVGPAGAVVVTDPATGRQRAYVECDGPDHRWCIKPGSRDLDDPNSVGVLVTGDSALPSYTDDSGQVRTRGRECDDSAGYQVQCVGPNGEWRVGPAGAAIVTGADGNSYAVPDHIATMRARVDAMTPEDYQRAAEELHRSDPASYPPPRYPITGPPPEPDPLRSTQLQNPIEGYVDQALDAVQNWPVLGGAVRQLREWTGW